MSIVSSIFVQELAQKDGRKWTEETHADNLGIQWKFKYLAEVAADCNAIMTARAASLPLSLQLEEIGTNLVAVVTIGSLAVPTFNYSTPGQNATALRWAYLNATDRQAIMIGDFLSSLTDTQLENAFNLTQTQVTNLRTNKLTPAATAAATIRTATGA